MSDIERFSEKIQERLRLDQQELGRRRLETNEQMVQVLERRETFQRAARSIVATVVYPRLRELSRNFDNATLMELDAERDLHALCEFSHTSRYPAKVTVDIALLPGEDYARTTVHYGLRIFPMLVEYRQSEEKTFPLDAEDEIGRWVEERLLGFLEIYLQLQVNPLYQKDSLVTDPVCNMTFPIDEAAAIVEWQGSTYHFCSKVCQEAFLKTHQ